MDVLETLLELERRFWETGDEAYYRDHFADDGLMAFHVGVMDKKDIIGAIDGADPWTSCSIIDPRLVQVHDGVAALVYTTEAHSKASDRPYRAAITSVYAHRDDAWWLVLHHQTPLG